MKKYARNQFARQLIDLPNCGGALLELVEGECPQEFERVVHSHGFFRFDNMGNNMMCPKAQPGS